MPSYRQLVHQWDAQLQQHQIPLETARVFLLELTRQQDVDLYLNYEQPASESIIQAFEAAGLCAGVFLVLRLSDSGE